MLPNPLMCDQEAGPLPPGLPTAEQKGTLGREAGSSAGALEFSIWHVAHSTRVALHSSEWNPQCSGILLESGC